MLWTHVPLNHRVYPPVVQYFVTKNDVRFPWKTLVLLLLLPTNQGLKYYHLIYLCSMIDSNTVLPFCYEMY